MKGKMWNIKGRTVWARWLDSYGAEGGWTPLEGFTACKLTVNSVGKVVYEDNDVISVAGSFAPGTEHTMKQANGIITIPKACITRVTSVSRGKSKFYSVQHSN